MSISEPFIRRPVATSLLAAALLLAGLWAYTLLAVAPVPRIDLPTIQVSVAMPGASPETMASSVATPLERRFGRIAGVTEITSSSSLGAASIILQFDLDRNVDGAARDVQAAIAAAASELPPNLPIRPTYRKVNPADSPILILSLTSATLPLKDVFEAANTVLAQKIAQVHGVGQVFVGGGQQPAVRVQVDPVALAGVGLSLTDVQNVIAAQTVDQPKGSFTGDKQGETIAANDQLLKATAYQSLVLTTNNNGQVVRLGDVANVFDDVENQRVAAWTDGQRSVLVVVFRQPDANIIETSDHVQAILPVLATSISPSIKVEVAFERTSTIRASVKDVEFSLLLSVVLVTAVVFIFLRDLRATAIPSITVPLSIVGTFGAMYLLNYSVDNLSLMALTISTGFVVDDAIVVTENISRFIERGETPMKAAFEGAKQIGFTIVSITVSLLAVFIPILLMGGIVGRLFREFAVTLGIAVALSALISLTLTPMMASRLLRAHKDESYLSRKTEAVFESILGAYDRSLRWVLRHQHTAQIALLATIGLTVYLFILVPKGLFPQQDTGRLMGATEAPQDVSFPRMKARQEAINAVISKDPDISHYVSFVGSSNRGGAGNTGTLFIDLKDKPTRKSSADEVIARLRPQLAKVEGIQLFLQAAQDIRIGGRLTRTQYQYTLQSADLAELNQWAPKVMERLKKVPQLKDVATDQQTNGLQLNINMDRDTAGRMGITASAIDQTLYDAFGQTFVAVFYTQINQYHVVLEVKPEFQKGPESINDLYVKSGSGAQVPLGSLVTQTPSSTSLSVNHQGQFPSVTLSFNLAPDASLGQAIDAIHSAEREIKLPVSVLATFSGTAQAFKDSLSSEPLLIVFALITVYIVLGMLYESYIHPITILSTLPSASVGALLALLAFKTDFSVIALIGIILLIGIVKKNAIMMIDFAIEAERDEGMEPIEAVHHACVQRFRPIMMTTMAAILGGIPLAIGGGTGSEFRQPLGITIVGGLLFSQALTLYTTPVIYLVMDRFTKAGRRHSHTPPLHAAPAE